DMVIDVNLKDNLISAKISAQNKNLAISKDKFSLKLNSQVNADLKYSLETKHLDYSADTQISKLDLSAPGMTDISGRLKLDNSGLSSDNLKANLFGIPVEAKIRVSDFSAPLIQAELSSGDLQLDSALQVKDKLITISKCKGRYFNSQFTLSGTINMLGLSDLRADISGDLNIDLKDAKFFFKKFQKELEAARPEGIIQARLNLSGNIGNLKSCALRARFSSPAVSVYGLKATDFLLDYSQADGLADISPIHLSLYDGAIEASVKANLNTPDLPYIFFADIEGVKIEKLRLDTAAKDKDIAGNIALQAKLNGFSGDISRLTGSGQIKITEGKLWQLSLFKGLGALLFARDFDQIIFSEASCGFSVQDKYIFSDNVKLKSNITDLTGSAKIGFDSSIDASINVKILNELAPLSGTFKDVTTAIMGQAGRFGVIKISGTLKEPKYKFQPAVVDIIKGLKDIFFGNTDKN
ncbi:MAG: DUF3971 domain-containing protein, partial [Candidatus Omnitrophica bacterium]|nr:DUF3971 domain-containing protein [Candidatus Omnitrophota bacterium]